MHLSVIALKAAKPATEEKSFVDLRKMQSYIDRRAVEFPFTFESTPQQLTADSQLKIFGIMQAMAISAKKDPRLLKAGLLAYPHPGDVPTAESCDFYYLDKDGTIHQLRVFNPLRQHEGAIRDRRSAVVTADVNPSMLAQLYAMLDLHRADHIISEKKSKLKDPFADQLYAWERRLYSNASVMGITEMERFLRNAIQYAQLPPIKVVVVEDAETCQFRYQLKTDGKQPATAQQGTDLANIVPDTDWLSDPESALFEPIHHEHQSGTKIELSDFSLEFPLTWGLCKEIVLHEASHYFAFLLPLNSKINRGEFRLNYAEYSELFCGHGALFCAIYLHMLWAFKIYDKESLYFNFSKERIPFFRLDNLTPTHIDHQIAEYIQEKRNKKVEKIR